MKLSESKNDIVAAIAYFDIFSYPLTSREIFLYLSHVFDYKEFERSLDELVRDKIIYQIEEFYSLQNNRELIYRRREGNRNARDLIKTAKKVGSILSAFPYVRGIAISGSLSKNFADEKSDVDLFIITAPNRLWIARTFMHVLKKLSFLVRKEHLFCMNYYIDEQTLLISEKNIYTAIEVATLIPLYGDEVFEQFYAANSWYRSYLPNNFMRISSAERSKPFFLKGMLEKLFDNRPGDKLDNWLMNVTAKRWAKKTQQNRLSSNGTIMAMSTEKHVAKPDPENFQKKLMKMYEDKLSLIFEKNESRYSLKDVH